MKIGLVTTLNTNIGDDFIREGILHCIRKIIPEKKLELVLLNKHQPHTVYPSWHPIRKLYREEFKPRRKTKTLRWLAERWLPPLGHTVFDDCDVLLQCGTPVIWDGCRHSEWARFIWRDVLARLAHAGKPLLNLGGGAGYPWLRQPETLIGNPDEEFIRLMLTAAQLTTVRDRLAQKLFGSLGQDVPQICCPALLTAQAYVAPAKPTRKVLVNYMPGAGFSDFGQGIDAKLWEETMCKIVTHLEQLGWQPLLLAHNATELAAAEKLWPQLPRVCPGSLREYFEVARDAAFGVFNRMHASVAVAGLGIPSVAVGTDARMLMVESVGSQFCFVKDATPERMFAVIDDLLRNRERESERLLALREATLQAYIERMRGYFVPGS